MADEKKAVSVPKSELQLRAERNKQIREEARKNRAARGVETDPGVTFIDLPQEVREAHFTALENNHKTRLKRKSNNPYNPSESFSRGDAISVRTR